MLINGQDTEIINGVQERVTDCTKPANQNSNKSGPHNGGRGAAKRSTWTTRGVKKNGPL